MEVKGNVLKYAADIDVVVFKGDFHKTIKTLVDTGTISSIAHYLFYDEYDMNQLVIPMNCNTKGGEFITAHYNLLKFSLPNLNTSHTWFFPFT